MAYLDPCHFVFLANDMAHVLFLDTQVLQPLAIDHSQNIWR